MKKNDDNRRQFILEMLGFTNMSSHADVVAHAEDIWGRIVARLAPLIGDNGFNALYERSVRLIMAQFDWLTMPMASQATGALFITLKSDLLSVDAALANEANTALLNTFTKLLSSLIGETLTNRLLHAAWVDEPEERRK